MNEFLPVQGVWQTFSTAREMESGEGQGQGMRTTELSDHRNLLIFLLCYRFSALKLHNKSLNKVPKECMYTHV